MYVISMLHKTLLDLDNTGPVNFGKNSKKSCFFYDPQKINSSLRLAVNCSSQLFVVENPQMKYIGVSLQLWPFLARC